MNEIKTWVVTEYNGVISGVCFSPERAREHIYKLYMENSLIDPSIKIELKKWSEDRYDCLVNGKAIYRIVVAPFLV